MYSAEPMMNRFSQFCGLGAILMASSGCTTVTDLITSNLPESHSGTATIVVSLPEQEQSSLLTHIASP
jgi:hypothetical protein